ncbi:MAG: MSCRAMM family protein [Sedimentisphaerales bacterium]
MKCSLRALIIISAAVFCNQCFADDSWAINTVAYGVITSGKSSVVVDINNMPIVICYASSPTNYFKLIKQTPSGYDVNLFGSIFSSMAYPHLKINSNNELGLSHIAGSKLYYACKGDWFDWQSSQVNINIIGGISSIFDMCFTSNDVPHILCGGSANYHVFFDIHSQQWTSESMSFPIAMGKNGEILTGRENGFAVYLDGYVNYLPTVGSSIIYDGDFTPDGLPVVICYKSGTLCYEVYVNDIIGWVETQIAPISSREKASLAFSSTGIPGIVYNYNGALIYTTNIAGSWTTTEIDTSGYYPDLIFDRNDKPLIAYNGTDTFGWNLPVVKLAGIGLTNMNNAFDISGVVTNHATGLPITNAYVHLYNRTFSKNATTYTDVNGFYKFDDMPPGIIDIYISAGSYAPANALNMTFEADIENLDFALMPYATLSGKVIDNTTGQPIPNVTIEYDNEEYENDIITVSDGEGNFFLSGLWPGIAEFKAMPDVNSGYAWNLPWGADLLSFEEGEQRSGRIIFLEKGTLVSGFVKDANGNPFANVDIDADGRNCDVWFKTDANGFYQIRLPKGDFAIQPDDDEIYGMLPITFTITDINTDVNLPDGFVYTSATGEQISGEVNNPGGYEKNGTYEIHAFEAGTSLNDPNSYYVVTSAAYIGMQNEGAFSINNLPPDVNYDIYIMAYTEFPDGRDSQTIRDVVFNVSPDTSNVYLEYNSAGSTVSGCIKNINDAPVLGAAALLFDSLGDFKGYCETDCNGLYTIYNVPVGDYTITAIHSKYANASTSVDVNDGIDANAGDIIMPFDGSKEGPDLNGNGIIDLFDIAELSSQWLDAGTNKADFNQDTIVNFFDWLPIANNWLWKAIWLNK